MAVFSVSTMEELIELSGIASGDVITLTADIDAVAQGYDDFVTLSTSYDVNLNGHTLSNVFLSGAGIFSKTISNGTLTNIYVDGSPPLYLEEVVASVFATGTVVLNLTKSAVDVTLLPTTRLSGLGSLTNRLSNAVIRNAFIRPSGSASNFVIGTSNNRFFAVVFDGCTFTPYGTNTSFTVSMPGDHSYCDLHNCTLNGDVVSLSSSTSTNLFGGGFTQGTSGILVTEAQLQNREYLEEIGFLP